MNEIEISAGLAPTPGYRYAKAHDNQLFVAGQVPLDSRGSMVGKDDPGAQAAQCLHNLFVLVSCHGFDPRDIQQLTIYVVGDRRNLNSAWDSVLQSFSGETPPATLLGVSNLGYEHQLVEVDAIVVREVENG